MPEPPAGPPSAADGEPGSIRPAPQPSVKAKAPVRPAPAPGPAPGGEPAIPGTTAPPIPPSPFKVHCEQGRLTVRRGGPAAFECTLEGWLAGPTNVEIQISPAAGGGIVCDNAQAFSSSRPVIRRSPLDAPTPFTVRVDTRLGGYSGGPITVGTAWEGSEDVVELTIDVKPGDEPFGCNPGKGSP